MARLAELDLITGDLERANSRVTEVERRNVGNFDLIMLTLSRLSSHSAGKTPSRN